MLGYQFGVTRGISDPDLSLAQVSKPGDRIPDSSGVTITMAKPESPPVAALAISGYLKGDVIYDFNGDMADLFLPGFASPTNRKPHLRMHARQSRLVTKSKVNTSSGQVRTHLEVDFFNSSDSDWDEVFTHSVHLRLRHAYGEWDFRPRWTFLLGQYWSNFTGHNRFRRTCRSFAGSRTPGAIYLSR
jgi:hypothetical protein